MGFRNGTKWGVLLAAVFLLASFLGSWGSARASTVSSVTTYDSCRKGVNDYLEPAIEAALSPSVDQQIRACSLNDSLESPNIADISRILGNPRLPPECVYTVMQKLSPVGQGIHYGRCDRLPSGHVVLRTAARGRAFRKPCITPEYHALVYSSFIQSMTCLGIDPKEIFPIFALESGFQLNIGNDGGDWGIAQLSPSGVAGTQWTDVLAKYRADPRCAGIRSEIAEPMSRGAPACERIGLPANPVRSFIYGGYLYLENKAIAEQAVRALIERRRDVRAAPFSNQALDSLTIELTRYMYNGGAGGVAQAFEAFIQERYNAGLSLTHMRTAFRAWLARYFGDGIPYFNEHPQMLDSMRKTVPGYAALAASFARSVGPECAY